MAKKYWKDTYSYQRIIEILNSYWIEEKDEKYVAVDMYFKHKDGMEQHKHIVWSNPNLAAD